MNNKHNFRERHCFEIYDFYLKTTFNIPNGYFAI